MTGNIGKFFAVVGLAAALLVTPASARGVQIDPDGVSWWGQIVAWFTGGADGVSATIDPNG